MRIKHHGVFHNEMKVLNWEDLRNSEVDQPYFLPFNKEDYLFKVGVDEPDSLTTSIINDLNCAGLKKIFSIGSGIATREYHLKTFSNLKVVVSDYNATVNRLKDFNVFDDALLLDALKDPLPIDDSFAVLFPRIDTEFEDEQLKELFYKCYNSGIKQIYFIPAELLSLRIVLAEIKTVLISIIKNRPLVFCGYARDIRSFKNIWGPYYQLTKKHNKDKQIYFLLSKLI